jgi:hypothetical protein
MAQGRVRRYATCMSGDVIENNARLKPAQGE